MVDALLARGEGGEGWVVRSLVVSCLWFLVSGFIILSCSGFYLLGDVGLLRESRPDFTLGLSHFQYESLQNQF